MSFSWFCHVIWMCMGTFAFTSIVFNCKLQFVFVSFLFYTYLYIYGISLLSADSASCWQSRYVTWASLGIACRRTQEVPKKGISIFLAYFISEASSSNCCICIISSQTLWPQTGECVYGLFIFFLITLWNISSKWLKICFCIFRNPFWIVQNI